MPDNPFVDLLEEFRLAYATYGDQAFFLVARTKDEVFPIGGRHIRPPEYVGVVPLSDHLDGDEDA